MEMSSYNNIIKNEPVISYLDEPKNENINPHKNSCEKCCTCNSTADRCPVNCSEFGDLFILDREFGGSYRSFSFCSLICLPVTLPTNSLLCGPCALYNIFRNKCANNSDSINYLC
jgi:hypothetical protein